jgi:uncharacterized protein YbjT (DUF2867 family)
MYLVTGATGNVGSNVVAQLVNARQKVRVFVRDADRVRHWGDQVQIAIGDFENADSFARAIAGVDGVFLLNGSPEQEPFRKLIAAAKSEGDPRVVFLSTFLVNLPDVQIGQLHKDKEEAIQESGLQWKFVRPGAFMTNSYQWIGSIRSEGVVYNSMGNGKTAPIAPEDIAAVVVKALTARNDSGEVFELTGGQLLSVPEQVSILADILTKAVRCIDVPIETAVQGLVRAGIPQQVAVAIGQSSEVVRDGRVADVTDPSRKL